MTDENITVYVEASSHRSGLSKEAISTITKSISVEQLSKNFRSFTHQMGEVFRSVDLNIEGLDLREVTVSVKVDAEGKIGLLGSGLSTSGSAGITLKFIISGK